MISLIVVPLAGVFGGVRNSEIGLMDKKNKISCREIILKIGKISVLDLIRGDNLEEVQNE
mgnify:CR=1 FL=1